MSIEMKMPRLSDTMEQGTIVRWAVKPGQKVRSGDVVADIETDKATMELQTFDDGEVAQLAVQEGQQVPVGTVIMVLAEAGEKADSLAAKTPAAVGALRAGAEASRPTPASSPAKQAASVSAAGGESADQNGHPGQRVFASPLARKIAAESGVDLTHVHGSGPSGRIVRKDVEAAMSTAPSVTGRGPATGRREVHEPSKISGLSAGAVPGVALPPMDSQLQTRTVTLSNMRGTIAKRLVQSKTTIPHYQVTVSVRMDALLSLRQQLNDQLASQGVKLSVNDFVVRACALAMHQHPYINSRWVEGQGTQGPAIEFVGDVNMGVAIALPVNDRGEGGGLVVATLRGADRMGLRQISAETKRLSEKARGKGLSIEELSDSTFTISNLGMFGVEHFTAIINPPNSAILAVGAAIEQPIVVKDAKTGEKKIVPGTLMQMTISSDHRVIDGAMAAQYLGTVKSLLEAPATLLV